MIYGRVIHRARALGFFVVRICVALIFCANNVASSAAAGPQSPSFNEYQLKAIFLFRFAQFVDWPTEAEAADQPFSICILGDDPFDRYLDDAVRGESINSRGFIVRQHRTADNLSACRILFISSSESHRVRQILNDVKGRDILTVSEIDNFAAAGGMVEFVTAEKRIRLKINVEAARAANLTLSSKLLRPATIVAANGA